MQARLQIPMFNPLWFVEEKLILLKRVQTVKLGVFSAEKKTSEIRKHFPNNQGEPKYFKAPE